MPILKEICWYTPSKWQNFTDWEAISLLTSDVSLFKFGNFTNIKVLFLVVPTDFPHKLVHMKSWKNRENVYSLYKTVPSLRGTKNSLLKPSMDNEEVVYVVLWKIPENAIFNVGALHVIKLACSSMAVLLQIAECVLLPFKTTKLWTFACTERLNNPPFSLTKLQFLLFWTS